MSLNLYLLISIGASIEELNGRTILELWKHGKGSNESCLKILKAAIQRCSLSNETYTRRVNAEYAIQRSRSTPVTGAEVVGRHKTHLHYTDGCGKFNTTNLSTDHIHEEKEEKESGISRALHKPTFPNEWWTIQLEKEHKDSPEESIDKFNFKPITHDQEHSVGVSVQSPDSFVSLEGHEYRSQPRPESRSKSVFKKISSFSRQLRKKTTSKGSEK